MAYPVGRNPNSLKNLNSQKGVPGPGRKKMTPQEKVIKREIRAHMRAYLESGAAASDFERVRERKPEVALDQAMDRIYGRTHTPSPSGDRINAVAVLVKVLCGNDDTQKQIEEKKTMEIELTEGNPVKEISFHEN